MTVPVCNYVHNQSILRINNSDDASFSHGGNEQLVPELCDEFSIASGPFNGQGRQETSCEQ